MHCAHHTHFTMSDELCFAYLRIWHRRVFAVDPTLAMSLYRVFTSGDKPKMGRPLRWRQGRRLRLRPRHGAVYFIAGPSTEDRPSDVYCDGRVWLTEGASGCDYSTRFRGVVGLGRKGPALFDDLVRCEIKHDEFWLVYYFNKLDFMSTAGTQHSFLLATDVSKDDWMTLARETAKGTLTPYPDVKPLGDFASYFHDYVIPGNVYWMSYASLKNLVLRLEMTFGPSHSLIHSYYARGWLVEYVTAGRDLALARFTQICMSCYDKLCSKGIKLPAHVFSSYTLNQLLDHHCC